MQKKFTILLFLFLVLVGKQDLQAQEPVTGTIVFHEGFEQGIGSGWSQRYFNGAVNWNQRKGAGKSAGGINLRPDTAAVGNFNAAFQFEGSNHYATMLVSPPIDLEFTVNPVMTFYHAQRKWSTMGPDVLGVYYSYSPDGPWIKLVEYLNEVPVWTKREVELPGGSAHFYLGFLGTSFWGMGVVLDEVIIYETGVLERTLEDINTLQASVMPVATESQNNPILSTRLRVEGNDGNLVLQRYTAVSANTNNNDLAPNGLKLWFTRTEVFDRNNLLATASGFSGGQVVFDNINRNIPTGYSYLWLTYDLDTEVVAGNQLDAYIPAGGIRINGVSYPAVAHNPEGKRVVVNTIFRDDFETDKGWQLTGEWERAVPQGLGGYNMAFPGSAGSPSASFAYTGTKVLGTDITGQGMYPGNYEPNLAEKAYRATSPELDMLYYTNVSLNFQRWLNVEFEDKVFIEVSTDGGTTWEQVWFNNKFEISANWSHQSYSLPSAARKRNVKVRFSLGPTDPSSNYSGWNIDDVYITGNYLTHDVGVVAWIGPNDGCGLTSAEDVRVWVRNYGAQTAPAGIPIGFSLDGGATWHMDVTKQSIAVEDSLAFSFTPKANFSQPGRYNQIIVKTFWDQDQFVGNDALNHKLFAIPTYTAPYSQNFAINDGLWTGFGAESTWMWAKPSGTLINQAQSGLNAWVTNAVGRYKTQEASWLQSPCFDFGAAQNPVIEFYLQTHTPAGQAGVSLQYSFDQGNNWREAEILDEQFAWNWFQDGSIAKLQDAFGQDQGWHGQSEGWQRVRAVLHPEVRGESEVMFRLIFAGGENPHASINWEGVAFDNFKIYESPNDVGVVNVLEPVTSCTLAQEQPVRIAIQNLGLNPVTAGTYIPVGLEIDEQESVYEGFELQSDLMPGQTINYLFNHRWDMQAIKTYSLTAFTMLSGDSDFYQPGSFNDTLQVEVQVFGLPFVDLGADIFTSRPDTVVLDAGAGFAAYKWQDNATDRLYPVQGLSGGLYKVTVTDDNGCQATDSVQVVNRDLGVVALQSPINSCSLGDDEGVTVVLENIGTYNFEAGTLIPLKLYLNHELKAEEELILANTLTPGQKVTHTFIPRFDLSGAGSYVFTVTHLLSDADPASDTKDFEINSFTYPQPNLGDTIYTQTPLSLVLDAGAQFATFQWQNGSTQQTYAITNPLSAWYTVVVTDHNGCEGRDSVMVITYDLEIAQLLRPLEVCESGSNESLGVQLINHGPEHFEAGTSFGLVLEVNGMVLAQENLVLTEKWLAGSSLNFSFTQTLDLSAVGSYDIAVSFAKRDANTHNDKLDVELVVHGYPQNTLPRYIATDEPEGLVLDAGAGYQYLWQDGSSGQTFVVAAYGEYWVEISNTFGCTTKAEVEVLKEFFDLSVAEILSPVNSCDGAYLQEVRIRIRNSGNSPIPAGTLVPVSFRLNGGSAVTETLSMPYHLARFHEIDYTFSQKLNITGLETYELEVAVNLTIDEVPENNMLMRNFSVYALPMPSLGPDIYALDLVGTVLSLSNTYNTYLWQDGSTASSFLVSSPKSATYSVTVTDGNGCANVATVKLVSYDLIAEKLLAPVSNCTLSNAENVVVRVKNQGYDDLEAGFALSLSYRIGEQSEITQNFVTNSTWSANTSRDFTFINKANLSSIGEHMVLARVKTPNANPMSNDLETLVQVPGKPKVNLGMDIYTHQPDTVVIDAGAGFYSYLWQDNTPGQKHQVGSYGWKWVFVTDQFGCLASDTIFVGPFTPVENPLQTAIAGRIYPNPSRGWFKVELELPVYETALIELMDAAGHVVERRQTQAALMVEEEFRTERLKPGVYFVNILASGQRKTFRLVVVNP